MIAVELDFTAYHSRSRQNKHTQKDRYAINETSIVNVLRRFRETFHRNDTSCGDVFRKTHSKQNPRRLSNLNTLKNLTNLTNLTNPWNLKNSSADLGNEKKNGARNDFYEELKETPAINASGIGPWVTKRPASKASGTLCDVSINGSCQNRYGYCSPHFLFPFAIHKQIIDILFIEGRVPMTVTNLKLFPFHTFFPASPIWGEKPFSFPIFPTYLQWTWSIILLLTEGGTPFAAMHK